MAGTSSNNTSESLTQNESTLWWYHRDRPRSPLYSDKEGDVELPELVIESRDSYIRVQWELFMKRIETVLYDNYHNPEDASNEQTMPITSTPRNSNVPGMFFTISPYANEPAMSNRSPLRYANVTLRRKSRRSKNITTKKRIFRIFRLCSCSMEHHCPRPHPEIPFN